jgi:ATP-dependent RNA helicase RhlE
MIDPVTVTGDTPLTKTVQQSTKPAVKTPPPARKDIKTAPLKEILAKTKTDSVLVFTRTPPSAQRVARQVIRAGCRVTPFKGNFSDHQPNVRLQGLPVGPVIILVVSAAGAPIDVSGIFRIINDGKSGVDANGIRNIGRAGRKDKNGDALTLVAGANTGTIRALEQLLDAPLELIEL